MFSLVEVELSNLVHPLTLKSLISAYNENILLAKTGLARENPELSIRPEGCGRSSSH